MTEAQAKTKVCPILTPRSPVDSPPLCVASACMMWRIAYTKGDDGFCGLAGAGGPYGYPPPATN